MFYAQLLGLGFSYLQTSHTAKKQLRDFQFVNFVAFSRWKHRICVKMAYFMYRYADKKRSPMRQQKSPIQRAFVKVLAATLIPAPTSIRVSVHASHDYRAWETLPQLHCRRRTQVLLTWSASCANNWQIRICTRHKYSRFARMLFRVAFIHSLTQPNSESFPSSFSFANAVVGLYSDQQQRPDEAPSQSVFGSGQTRLWTHQSVRVRQSDYCVRVRQSEYCVRVRRMRLMCAC